MKAMRAALLALILIVACPNASATAYTTDQSDIWEATGEGGWAIQMIQRDSTIFATIYVYAPTTLPIWYVATMNPVGSLVWSGDLYTTTGPWFGTVPFDPNNVAARKVGTMIWSSPFVTSGTLTYTVDGVTVVKNLVRSLIKYDDFNGTYLGAFHGSASNCANPANNVSNVESYGTITVVQNGLSATVTFTGGGTSVTTTGVLTQNGQFGTVTGTYAWAGGEVGNGHTFEMNVQFNSIHMRFTQDSTSDGCHNTGWMGGIRSRPNG